MKSELRRKKIFLNFLFIFFGVFILLIGLVIYLLYHDIFYLEGYCEKVAMKEVGENGWSSKQVYSPYWDGKIFINFAKQLECEHNDKPFILF